MFNPEVLNLEAMHAQYVKIKRYTEAKKALATMSRLKSQQCRQQAEAFRKKQDAERLHLLQQQDRERSVFENKGVNDRYQLMAKRKQATELLIRKYKAMAGLMTRQQQKERTQLQVWPHC